MSEKQVWKTTIVIYSPFNPTEMGGNDILSYLARDAEEGESICADWHTDIANPDEMVNAVKDFFEIDDD